MNAITYVVHRLMDEYPRELLDKTFLAVEYTPRSYHQYLSLDNEIINQVIARRVCTDINLYGGTEVYLPCRNLEAEQVDRWNTIYRVPKAMTNGRDIVRVVAMAYGQETVYNAFYNNGYNSSMLTDTANGILASAGRMPIVQTAYCHLINPNTILVTDGSGVAIQNGYLRVWLGSDATLSHLQPTALPKFYELCQLAVEMVIYSKNIVKIDREVVEGGWDIGVYRSLVEGMSDAKKMYQEALVKWSVVNILNDPKASENATRLIMGGRF